MKGCRPLAKDEVKAVSRILAKNTNGLRDKALFVFGVRTGFRITEILSLKVKDVWKGGKVVDDVKVERKNMKLKKEGRTVPLAEEAKKALTKYIKSLGDVDLDSCLFQSRKGENKPISRVQAYRILQTAFETAGLTGNLGTHSMRKTFAKRVYCKVGNDIFLAQQALGHENIETTARYLSFAREEITRAILSD